MIINTDIRKFPFAANPTQKGNFKSRLQAMRVDGTLLEEKTKKNLAFSDIICPVCDILERFAGLKQALV